MARLPASQPRAGGLLANTAVVVAVALLAALATLGLGSSQATAQGQTSAQALPITDVVLEGKPSSLADSDAALLEAALKEALIDSEPPAEGVNSGATLYVSILSYRLRHPSFIAPQSPSSATVRYRLETAAGEVVFQRSDRARVLVEFDRDNPSDAELLDRIAKKVIRGVRAPG